MFGLVAPIFAVNPTEKYCDGKPVPFTTKDPLDLNGDGIEEKIFLCGAGENKSNTRVFEGVNFTLSEAEPDKTNFIAIDGKTGKVIFKMILDIDPVSVWNYTSGIRPIPDGAVAELMQKISISVIKNEKYSYFQINAKDNIFIFDKFYNLFFHNNNYIGNIITSSGGVDGISEGSKMEELNHKICGNMPCIAVYDFKEVVRGPVVEKKLKYIYMLSNGNLYQIYEGKEEMMYFIAGQFVSSISQEDFCKNVNRLHDLYHFNKDTLAMCGIK
jgi:hypothetical protein